MPIFEVKIRKLLLFFQEMAHGVRYILHVNIKNFSLKANILVNPFKSSAVII